MSDLQDRPIVVTGGGSGIGRAAVMLLAERGARVAVLDVNGESAAASASAALDRGAAGAMGFSCDVSIEAEVEAAFDRAQAAFGPFRGLFANAGIGTGGMLHELELSLWNRVMSVNLGGIFLCCKYALRSMVDSGTGGSLVCTSSVTGFTALAAGGVPAYSTSKGGISSLIRCLAVDYAPYGIRVNAIAPGATETKLMWDTVAPDDIPRMRETINREVPLGRLAEPIEIARAAVWLLSDDASYVTGTHLICDGGVLAKSSISV